MDPLYEQRLRDEVIYLHSLWHQGPPRPAVPATAYLQPLKTTQFKKKKKKKGRRKSGQQSTNNTAPESISSPGVEWPCPASPPSPSTTGWPSLEPKPDSQPPLSTSEQSKLAAKRAHRKALKAVHEFLMNNNNNSDDSDVAIDSSGDEDDELMEEDYGREEYSLFFKLFRDDAELSEYYEKNFAQGEFNCLVCGAIGGKRTTKKFKGCLALVQHSITIANTKKRRAHRAFGQAVCEVLGWNIDNLPAIVSMLSDQLGEASGAGSSDKKESFITPVNNVDSVNADALEDKNEEAAPESLYIQGPPRLVAPALAPAPAHLQPLKTTQFKKQKKCRGKSGQESTNNTAPKSNSSPGTEWPCPASPPPPSTTGWPSLEPKPDSQPPLSTAEQSKLAAKHAHWKALKVVHEFLMNNNNNSDDSDDAIDSSGDEDDELMEEDFGREEYSFFFKLFRDETELSEYYEKNFAQGEFNCLVCGAIGGKRTTKKFKGCLALVQHSITIANTKKRRAHRAFGQAVCKVLGWNIDNLPAIVSMLSDQLGEASGAGSSDNKERFITPVNNVDSVNDDALEGKNEEAAPESVYIQSGISPNDDAGDVNSMTCPDAGKNLEDDRLVHTYNVEEPASDLTSVNTNSLACPDVDKNLENLGMVYQHNMEEPASQGLTDNPLTCPNADKHENLGNLYQQNGEQPVPEGLTINSLTSTDADRNLENLVLVHSHNVEDTAQE